MVYSLIDVCTGESGSSVRVVVDGRDVPTLQVARHPVHKGFIMESCWALYTAFPMPAPGQGLDDDDLSVSVRIPASFRAVDASPRRRGG